MRFLDPKRFSKNGFGLPVLPLLQIHGTERPLARGISWLKLIGSDQMLSRIIEAIEIEIAPAEIPRQPPMPS
jgi:hypothetical protein